MSLSSQSFPLSLVLAGAASLGDGSVLVYGGMLGYGGTETFVYTTFVLSLPVSASPLTASAYAVDAGMAVSFTGTPTGGIGPLEGNFTFGDGTSVATGNATASHNYTDPGTYLVNYTVTDWLGRSATASAVVTVNPDVAIAALAASATNATVGSLVLFGASVSGGTAPLSYSWRFGDGTSSTSALTTHDWSSAGTYAIDLTVTDSLGARASQSLTVTVTAAVTVPSPGPSDSPGFSWTSGSGLVALLALVAIVVAFGSVLGTILWTRRRTRAAGDDPASWQMPTPRRGAGSPRSTGTPSAPPPEESETPPLPPLDSTPAS